MREIEMNPLRTFRVSIEGDRERIEDLLGNAVGRDIESYQMHPLTRDEWRAECVAVSIEGDRERIEDLLGNAVGRDFESYQMHPLTRDEWRAKCVAALIPDIGALRAACVRAASNGAPWAGIAAHAVELAAEAVERCEGVPDRYADRAAWRVDGVRDFLRRAGYYGKGDE